MSIFLNHPCEKCNAATGNEQNEFADYICDDCIREPCEYCGPGRSTGLPGNACENCMNTGLKYPTAKDLA